MAAPRMHRYFSRKGAKTRRKKNQVDKQCFLFFAPFREKHSFPQRGHEILPAIDILALKPTRRRLVAPRRLVVEVESLDSASSGVRRAPPPNPKQDPSSGDPRRNPRSDFSAGVFFNGLVVRSANRTDTIQHKPPARQARPFLACCRAPGRLTRPCGR